MNSKELFDILHPGMIVHTHEDEFLTVILHKTRTDVLSILIDPYTGELYEIDGVSAELSAIISDRERVDIFDKDGVLLYEFGKS